MNLLFSGAYFKTRMRESKKAESPRAVTMAHLGFLKEARHPVPRPQLSRQEAKDRRNLQKVMVFPAIMDRRADRPELYAVSPSSPPPANDASEATATTFVETPVVVGLLLLLAPPVGLSVLWLSSAYKRDAKIALSVLSTITFLASCAVAIAYLR